METTYADSWSDMTQPCEMDLWIMKWRSTCPIFHGPVILPYILKTIWSMNITLWDCESVWHSIWPQNKCRSLWPIFHGPVILPYSLKTFDIWTQYFGIMSQYDPMFDLKIFVTYISGSTDFALYFDCLVYVHHTFGVWINSSELWPQNKYRSLWPIFHGPVIVPYSLKTISCMNIII